MCWVWEVHGETITVLPRWLGIAFCAVMMAISGVHRMESDMGVKRGRQHNNYIHSSWTYLIPGNSVPLLQLYQCREADTDIAQIQGVIILKFPVGYGHICSVLNVLVGCEYCQKQITKMFNQRSSRSTCANKAKPSKRSLPSILPSSEGIDLGQDSSRDGGWMWLWGCRRAIHEQVLTAYCTENFVGFR